MNYYFFVITFLIHHNVYLFNVMCLKVFKKRTPVIIFGCNRKGVSRNGRKIFYEEVAS